MQSIRRGESLELRMPGPVADGSAWTVVPDTCPSRLILRPMADRQGCLAFAMPDAPAGAYLVQVEGDDGEILGFVHLMVSDAADPPPGPAGRPAAPWPFGKSRRS